MQTFKKIVATVILGCSGVMAHAESTKYPDRPVKIVVPFGPGGGSDNVARLLGQYLAEELKVPVVIENKPGAAGNIGLSLAARAPADGYTVFLGNISTNAINQWTYANHLDVKPLKDLRAVSRVAMIPGVLVGGAHFPPNNVRELVTYAKSHPGEVNHASAGAGSYAMIDILNFEKEAGLKMVHVPFKGGAGQYVTAIVANEVQISFTNASSVIALIKAGRLKALAVTTPERMAEFPNTPTMAESGFEGVGTSTWQGLFVPAATPDNVVNKLHAAVTKVLARKEIKEGYGKMMIIPSPSASAAEFDALVASDTKRWGKFVKDFDLVID